MHHTGNVIPAFDFAVYPAEEFYFASSLPGQKAVKTYYIYIMAKKRIGILYIGLTNNLLRRVRQHKNNLYSGFTKKYGIHRLVWYKATTQIEGAISREKQMKKWRRGWKIKLIEEENPNWDDLYEDLF